MEQDNLKIFSGKIEAVFSKNFLNGLARSCGFLKRERLVTPERLLLSILSVVSASGIKTLAELHRGFNAMFGTNVQYKPFHNQLRKAGLADFMKEVVGEFFTRFSCRILSPKSKHTLSKFKGIKIHDGSSFALKPGLKRHFPGRFNKIKPAAVELHTTLDLFEGQPDKVVLTPDTTSERNEMPHPEDLVGYISMFDRGYFTLDYMQELISVGAHFLIRAKSDCNPLVLSARRQDGMRIKGFEGKKLRKGPRFSKSHALDLKVRWRKAGKDIICRLIISWNPKTKAYFYLATNLEDEFNIDDIFDLYNLRWQVELLFKEWKSSANLHCFRTNDPNIAEVLIWASIAAATFKRFLAYSTQMFHKVEISTLITASAARFVLPGLFSALSRKSSYLIRENLRKIFKFFSENARRNSIKKDYNTGRMKSLLAPSFSLS